MAKITESINKIISLYDKYGKADYIGENVSQIEHALQCGQLAINKGYSNEIIIGALLHDIGQLIGLSMLNDNDIDNEYGLISKIGDSDINLNLGVSGHEYIGGKYLRKHGISEYVVKLVENHVIAKIYLVKHDSNYMKNLSDASKQTMIYQIKNRQNIDLEMEEFEKSIYFEDSIKIRLLDDEAKNKEMITQPIEFYIDIIRNVMKK